MNLDHYRLAEDAFNNLVETECEKIIFTRCQPVEYDGNRLFDRFCSREDKNCVDKPIEEDILGVQKKLVLMLQVLLDDIKWVDEQIGEFKRGDEIKILEQVGIREQLINVYIDLAGVFSNEELEKFKAKHFYFIGELIYKMSAVSYFDNSDYDESQRDMMKIAKRYKNLSVIKPPLIDPLEAEVLYKANEEHYMDVYRVALKGWIVGQESAYKDIFKRYDEVNKMGLFHQYNYLVAGSNPETYFYPDIIRWMVRDDLFKKQVGGERVKGVYLIQEIVKERKIFGEKSVGRLSRRFDLLGPDEMILVLLLVNDGSHYNGLILKKDERGVKSVIYYEPLKGVSRNKKNVDLVKRNLYRYFSGARFVYLNKFLSFGPQGGDAKCLKWVTYYMLQQVCNPNVDMHILAAWNLLREKKLREDLHEKLFGQVQGTEEEQYFDLYDAPLNNIEEYDRLTEIDKFISATYLVIGDFIEEHKDFIRLYFGEDEPIGLQEGKSVVRSLIWNRLLRMYICNPNFSIEAKHAYFSAEEIEGTIDNLYGQIIGDSGENGMSEGAAAQYSGNLSTLNLGVMSFISEVEGLNVKEFFTVKDICLLRKIRRIELGMFSS